MGRIGFAVALALLLALAAPAASPQKKALARAEFQKAEQMRAALRDTPDAERRAADYARLVRTYERVVSLAPTVSVADDAVLAEAELLAEQGHRFKDPKSLQRAQERYRFLVSEYPHSTLVARARTALAELENAPAAPAVAPRPNRATPAAAENTARVVNAEYVQSPPPAHGTPLGLVTSIRTWSTSSYTRVVIEMDSLAEYQSGRIANPDRIFFDLHGVRLSPAVKRQNFDSPSPLLQRIRVAQNQIGIARIVLEVGSVGDYSAFLLPNPHRLIVDINAPGARNATNASKQAAAAKAEPEPPARKNPPKQEPQRPLKSDSELTVASSAAPTQRPTFERVVPDPPRTPARTPAVSVDEKPKETAAVSPRAARPTSTGQRSLIRALGLKIGRIVIDAGHGGHDTGTIGPSGFTEKELVLDVAQRLGALVEERLGGEVVYTRTDDTFIPLEQRTAIANQKQADLFVSIHANSSRDASARGIETYYLNFTSAQDALEVAARENAVSEKSIHQLQDLVKKITLKEKLDESREFAAEVQKSLYTTMSRGNSGLRNRGVKKAPFIVLIGANMPSILAEISFVSNPTDERLLRKAEYRQKIAEALFRGIQKYVNSLAGIKVAALSE